MTQSDDKSCVLRLLYHKLFQRGVQDFLQFRFVLGCGLREQESPDAHGGVHDVTSLQHAVEVPLDALEVELAVGVVGLVQDDEAEHVVFDAVPHGGIVGTNTLEIALYRQQMAGVTRQIVEAHAGKTQRVDILR